MPQQEIPVIIAGGGIEWGHRLHGMRYGKIEYIDWLR
jgi:hypothetical protein